MNDDIIQQLTQACDGLEYPSESDAAFDVFRWEPKGAPAAREQIAAHAQPGRRIDEVSLDQFFAELSQSEDADRFAQLRRTLESQLKNVKAFRVGAGDVKVDIYLIGRTPANDWSGVHTQSVET